MNKRKLLIVALLVVVLISMGVYALLRQTTSEPKSVCGQFIAYIQKGDAQNSYNLYTGTAQSTTSLEDWKKQVPILQTAYSQEAKPKLTSKPENTSEQTIAPDIEERYEITNFNSTYKLTCFLKQADDKNYYVDGFVSEPKLP